MGLLIVAAYIDLISGQVAEGTFTPETHFAYLTNQTSYSNIVVLFAGAWLGTQIGTHLLKKISDARFKVILKWLLTALAIRLIVLNGYALLWAS